MLYPRRDCDHSDKLTHYMGSHSLLQGIFPTQGLSPGLPHCRQILYQLSHKGSPRTLEWVAYPFSSGSSRPGSPAFQADSLPAELPGRPRYRHTLASDSKVKFRHRQNQMIWTVKFYEFSSHTNQNWNYIPIWLFISYLTWRKTSKFLKLQYLHLQKEYNIITPIAML